MKLGATVGSESVQHKRYITDLDQSSTGFYTALIVLAVPAVPAMPGVRPLNHPAFFPRREALRARRTHLHFDVPASTRFGHPGVQGMIVILLVRKNRAETRKVLWRDVAEQNRCRHALIESCTGNADGKQQPQRLDQERPLTPCDVLAAILPTLGATHLGGLDRLALDADGAWGGLAPCWHAGLCAQGFDQFFPGPIVAPLGKVVLDGAFGEEIVRQHIPLAAAPVEREQRIADFPHVHLARAPSSLTLFGRGDHRSHNRPLLVREIRRILLSLKHFILPFAYFGN